MPKIRTNLFLGLLTTLVAAAPSTTQPAECCMPPAASVALYSAPATRPAAAEPAEKADAAALFEKLKTLAGTWDADAMGTPCKIEYSLTGGGTTVVENAVMHGGMITMYSLDGDRVIATHYCGAGNQPRITATGLADGKATFAYLDATGMASTTDTHMHQLEVTFADDGTVTEAWTMYAEGKSAGVVTITMTKAK